MKLIKHPWLTKLRNWLIKTLAGKNTIALNVTFDDGVVIDEKLDQYPAYFVNVRVINRGNKDTGVKLNYEIWSENECRIANNRIGM